jgi:hypothetical protein
MSERRDYVAIELFKNEPVWGVVIYSEAARVELNTFAHHPRNVLGTNLTHEEATAIAKMFNSGELHGTN